MLLLLATLYCHHPLLLHINILPSSPVLLHIYTVLVSLLFGTVIPTSFNILVEMFYSLVSLVFRCLETAICHIMRRIKAYNSIVQRVLHCLIKALWACWRHPYTESVEKNLDERKMQGGKGEDTSTENLANTGDGGRGYGVNQHPLLRMLDRVHKIKNGVQQGGSTVGVALSCTSYNDFLVKGTSPAKKKPIYAEMNINT